MLFKTALRKAAKLGLAFTAITALLLAGCGGGGSSTTTPPASTAGGVAAVGYPIVGAAVQVRCAAGSALNTTTSGTGTWQVTFSGQTAPCAVQVSGGTINGATNATNFHSITTTTAVNTVNVSPLTDLVVANLVGTSTPSVWFASLSSTPSLLTAFTQTAVDAALTKLVAAFPELPLNTNNPLTMTFSATPGTVGDDMLAALQTAMTSSSTTYATLLSNAAAPGFTAPAAGFSTALATAYASTASGSAPPTITSFTPGSGAAGSTVIIAGTNLTAVTEVLFTGPSPSTAFASATITTHTATSISATVPASLAAGGYTISVIHPGGELAATGSFTVTAAAAGGGTTVTLTGPFTSISGLAYDAALSTTLVNAAGTSHSISWKNTTTNELLTVSYVEPAAISTYQFSATMVSAPSGAAAAYITIGASANQAICVGSDFAGNVLNWPLCSSIGITFDKAAGTVTFASTPVRNAVTSATGTASGSFSFPPF